MLVYAMHVSAADREPQHRPPHLVGHLHHVAALPGPLPCHTLQQQAAQRIAVHLHQQQRQRQQKQKQ